MRRKPGRGAVAELLQRFRRTSTTPPHPGGGAADPSSARCTWGSADGPQRVGQAGRDGRVSVGRTAGADILPVVRLARAATRRIFSRVRTVQSATCCVAALALAACARESPTSTAGQPGAPGGPTTTSRGAPQLPTLHVRPDAGSALDTLTWAGARRRFVAELVDSAEQRTPADSVTWASRDAGVASVAPDGTITAHGDGTAWVVASAPVKDSVRRDSVVVIVARRIALITLAGASNGTPVPDAGAFTVPVPRLRYLHPYAYDSGGTIVGGSGPSWQSSAPTVASVDAGGVVTATTPGTAAITYAVTAGGVQARKTWTFNVVTRTLRVDQDTLDVGVGQTTAGVFTPGPFLVPEYLEDDETAAFTFTADDPTVVTVPPTLDAFAPSTYGGKIPLTFVGRAGGVTRVRSAGVGFTPPASVVVRVTPPRFRLELISPSTAAVGSWPYLRVSLVDGRGELRRSAAVMPYVVTPSDTAVLGLVSASSLGPSYAVPAGEVVTFVQAIARAPGRAWLRVSAPGYQTDSVAVTVAQP